MLRDVGEHCTAEQARWDRGGEERHATGVLEPCVFECCTAADGDVVGVLPGVGMGGSG